MRNLAFAAFFAGGAAAFGATTVTWSSTSDTTFGSGTNWVGGVAPVDDLTSSIARFDGTGSAAPVLAASQSVAGLAITTTTSLTAANGAGLTLGGSGLTVSSLADTTISAPLVVASAMTLSNTSHLTLAGGLTLNSTGTFSGAAGVGSVDITGVVSGTGTLVWKGGAGLTLTQANSYTGGTSLFANSVGLLLNINHPSAIGTGTLTLTLVGQPPELGNTSGAPVVLSTNNVQNWNGNFQFRGPAALDLGTGAVTMNAARTIRVIASTLTVGGAISDGGSGFGLIKTGAGTLALTGNSTYAGSTLVQDGTLSVSSLANLGMASALGVPTSAINGTIGIGNGTAKGALAYTGPATSTDRVVNLAGTTGGATLEGSGMGSLVFTSNFTATGLGSKTLTLSGTAGRNAIAGAVVDNSGTNKTSLTKAGSGSWILGGDNTDPGTTAVNAGTLIVNGTLAAGSAVTVNSGGTLVGNGLINGLTTIASGGHLAPGDGVGTLVFGNGLTLASGAILDFELGTTSDKLMLTGGTLTGPAGLGGLTLNLADAGGFAPGTYTLFDFVTGGTLTSNFDPSDFQLGTLLAGTTAGDYSLTLAGNTLRLTVANPSTIPEPATTAAFLGALALLAAAHRRRA